MVASFADQLAWPCEMVNCKANMLVEWIFTGTLKTFLIFKWDNVNTFQVLKWNAVNRKWHISTTPNTIQPKFFAHISNLYSSLIWSPWVALQRKIKTWTRGKKKVSLVLKVECSGGLRLENSTFSTKLNFFSSGSNFDFSLQGNSGWPY